MAKDVFATPVSTVASESVFSTGGRVLDTFRSSLNPEMVVALICYQNWLRPCLLQFK
uniref:AC transposase n=1 Tax=Cajanus cajan TaxID=3821 RepID=A0A151TBT5_CAJCA|nr:Putative AC transposase [Cajanus cajan]